MVSLLDIAPATAKVRVADVEVVVFAVNAKAIAALLRKFPEIAKLFAGKDVSSDEWAAIAPEAVVAIIAAGCGHMGEEAWETKIGELNLEQQIDLLEAILALTMPSGIRPFAEKLNKLGLLAQGKGEEADASGKAVDMKSQKQSKP